MMESGLRRCRGEPVNLNGPVARNGYLLRKDSRNLIFRVYEVLLLFHFTDSRSFTVFIPAFASSSARLFMEVM